VATATAAIASAMPSTIPSVLPPLPSSSAWSIGSLTADVGSAAPDPSASDSADDEEEETAPEPSVALTPHPVHPYTQKHVPGRPKHYPHRTPHKKHY
jgi:hypothetical protein